MKTKIISPTSNKSCPLCGSSHKNPILLKNFKLCIDPYFKNLEEKNAEGINPKNSNWTDKKNSREDSGRNYDEVEGKDPDTFEARDYDPAEALFYKCLNCDGIFRNPDYILPEHQEHHRYLAHNNDLLDPKYIEYLNVSISPFLSWIHTDDLGLDFGCGPTKGIEHILKPLGYNLLSYDKYFFPHLNKNKETFLEHGVNGLGQAEDGPVDLERGELGEHGPILTNYSTKCFDKTDARVDVQNSKPPPPKFDYIFCHEVIEHFIQVKNEFEHLLQMLKPQGRLFVRTELQPSDLVDFQNWYYKNDSTHVFFYSEKCLLHICQKFNLVLKVIDKNKFVLIKD